MLQPILYREIDDLRNTSALLTIVDNNGHPVEYNVPGNATRDRRLIGLWLDGKSEKTIRAYVQDINKFYTHLLERYEQTLANEGMEVLSVQQVRVDEVQAFKNSLTHLKPATQARTVAAVKSLLTYGADTRILPFNVGRAVKLPHLEDTLAERITSEDNIARLLYFTEKHTRNHAMLVLLYRGGLRDAELCDLQWRNLQAREDAGQVSIFGKGKHTRTVLLGPKTWQEVMRLKRADATPDGYVFESREVHINDQGKGSRRLDESTVLRLLKEIAVEANVETYVDEQGHKKSRVSPHWLRHAHATHARKRGASLTLVQKTLGHASITTTTRYDHVAPDESSATFLEA